tara:strand:- start:1481 stop:2596 length:1116 start_codon:yes stop_codon:yes gene_type:complete
MTKAAELAKMGEVLTNSQIGGRRNIIINGAMQVAQRSTGVVGVDASGYYTVDRHKLAMGNTAGRLTMTQESITDLSGFTKAIKLACTTADTSIASNEYLFIQHSLEGQDLQQLKKGTSDAEKVTLSFYVKGNASATYTVELEDGDNSRLNSQEFSVTSSWTRVVKTFVGDTTGTLDNDNAESLRISFWLHGGSNYTGGTHSSNTWHTTENQRLGDNQTSFFDSTNRTFFITGIQLEIGEQATTFEHLSKAETEKLCHRYYQAVDYEGFVSISTGIMFDNGGSAVIPMHYLFGKMRSTPTITLPTAGTSTGNISLLTSTSSYPSTIGSHATPYANDTVYTIRGSGYSGLPNAGGASWFYPNGDVTFKYDAEL